MNELQSTPNPEIRMGWEILKDVWFLRGFHAKPRAGKSWKLFWGLHLVVWGWTFWESIGYNC